MSLVSYGFLCCLLTVLLLDGVSANYTIPLLSGYVRGRSVQFYLLDLNISTSTSPIISNNAIVPSRMFVFRVDPTIDSADLQPPVFTESYTNTTSYSVVRQVVIVVVPRTDAVNWVPIRSEGAIPSYLLRTVSTYRHVPMLNMTNITFEGNNATYVRKLCYVNNITGIYLDLGTIDVAATKITSAITLRMLNGQTVTSNYLLAFYDGDVGFTPFVTLEIAQVGNDYVSGTYTSQSSVSSLLKTTDARLRLLLIARIVQLSEDLPVNYTRKLGWYQGTRVSFYEFNASRVSTYIGTPNVTRPMLCYTFRTTDSLSGARYQPNDVRASISDPTLYSDLCHVVIVVIPNGQGNGTVFMRPEDIPSYFTKIPTGMYWTCPVVHPQSTLELQDRTQYPMTSMYSEGKMITCFDFGYQEFTKTVPGYTIVQNGVSVVGNDVFSVLPFDEAGYSNFVWVTPVPVTTEYLLNTITSISEINTVTAQSSQGYFSLRPVVDYKAFDGTPAAGKNWIALNLMTSVKGSILLRFAINASYSMLDVYATATYSLGYVALSFTTDTVSTVHGKTNEFTVGYVDASGRSCARTFISDDATGTNPYKIPKEVFTGSNATNLVVQSTRLGHTILSYSLKMPTEALTSADVRTKISFAGSQSTPIADCTVRPSQLTHNGIVGSKLIYLADPGRFATPSPPTSTAVLPSTGVTAAPPSPLSTPTPVANYTGFGSYHFDYRFTLRWSIDLTLGQISLTFLLTGMDGWAAIGLGNSQMLGTDVIMVWRDPNGTLHAEDRKTTSYALPPRDEHQDVYVVDSTRAIINRALDTGDRRTSVQRIYADTQYYTVYARSNAWMENELVNLYIFTVRSPAFGLMTTTSTANMYTFVMGEPALYKQTAIVDVLPGQSGYSDLWRVIEVTVPGGYPGPAITWYHDIPTSWVQREVGIINCPVVHVASQVQSNETDKYPRMSLYYRGDFQACINFQAATGSVREMRTLVDPLGNTVGIVLAPTPSPASFCYNRIVNVNSSVTSKTITSFADVASTNAYVNVSDFGQHINCPALVKTGIKVTSGTVTSNPSATATPSPPGASLTYASKVILYDDSFGIRVILEWNFLPFQARKTLQVRITGEGVLGYIAIGFSNGTVSDKMANSELIVAYTNINSTSPCVRQFTSAAKEGSAASITPSTMPIRNVVVVQSEKFISLAFERDLTMAEYASAAIPLDGSTSRVLYALTRYRFSLECDSFITSAVAGLYHSAAPHGSKLISWTSSSNSATLAPPTSPPSTSDPSVLKPTLFTLQSVYYKGVSGSMYCFDNSSSTLANLPFVYTFPALGQFSVVDAVPGMSTYTGVWAVVEVTLSTQPVQDITSLTTLQAIIGNKQATLSYTYQLMNCPVVHPDSMLSSIDDNLNITRRKLFFRNQIVVCLDFGTGANQYTPTRQGFDGLELNTNTVANMYVPRVALTGQSFFVDAMIDDLGMDVKDEYAPSLRQLVFVDVPDSYTPGLYKDMARISALSLTQTQIRMNCVVRSVAKGTAEQLRVVTLPLSVGRAQGRTVKHVSISRTPRIGNAFGIRVNKVYVFRMTTPSLDSAKFTDQLNVIDVLPGETLYSDLWQVVFVTNTTRVNVSAVSDWSSFIAAKSTASTWTFTESTIYWNAPVIHMDSVIEGATAYRITKEKWVCRNITVGVLRFHTVTNPPRIVADAYMYEQGVQYLFQGIPGDLKYTSFYNVMAINTNLQSLAAYNKTLHGARPLYSIINAPMIEVSEGTTDPVSYISGAPSLPSRLKLWASEGTESYDAYILPNSVAYNTTTSTSLRSKVYVFRRGLRFESDELDIQRPIMVDTPEQTLFSIGSGYSGYADQKDVIVVKVPTNYTFPNGEITSAADLLRIGRSNSFTFNDTTGLVALYPVLSTNQSVGDYATTTAWFNTYALTYIDMGVRPLRYIGEPQALTPVVIPIYPNGTIVEGIISLSPRSALFNNVLSAALFFVPPSYVPGTFTVFSQLTDVQITDPLVVISVSIVQSNSLRPTATTLFSGYSEGKPTNYLQFNYSRTTTPTRKYVFRRGSSYYSPAVPVLLSIVETFPDDANYCDYYKVFVVTIPSTQSPSLMTSAEDLYAALVLYSWTVTDSGLTENAPVAHYLSTVDSRAIYVTKEIVYCKGRRLAQFVLGLVDVTVPTPIAIQLIDVRGVQVNLMPSGISSYGSRFTTLNTYVCSTTSFASTPITSITSVPSDASMKQSIQVNIYYQFVARDTMGSAMIAENMYRRVGWVENRRATWYQFNDSRTDVPNVMYMFRRDKYCVLNAANMLVNMPYLLTKVPGHDGYSDLKQMVCVVVPDTIEAFTAGPTSLDDLDSRLLRDGWSLVPTSIVVNYPIVHPSTNIENIDSTTYPKFALYFENSVRYAFNFGAVSTTILSQSGVAYFLYRNGEWLSSNVVLDSPGYSNPIKRIKRVAMLPTYVTDTARNASDVARLSISTQEGSFMNLPVLSVTAAVSEVEYDDFILRSGSVPVIWAYGQTTMYPITFQPHDARGSVMIDFYTGVTDQTDAPNPLLSQPYSIVFDEVITATWEIKPVDSPLGKKSTKSHRSHSNHALLAGPSPTYDSSSLEVHMTLTVRVNEWAAIGISNSGGMADADVMMVYHNVLGDSSTYTFLQDQKVEQAYVTPVADKQQDVRLLYAQTILPQGYVVKFARKLVTNDAQDYAIVDNTQSIIWAHGKFDTITKAPLVHTARGSVRLNMLTGVSVVVSRTSFPAWPIIVTVAVMVIVSMVSVLLNLVSPGYILWGRLVPAGGHLSEFLFGWLTTMVFGEHLILVIGIGLICMMGGVAHSHYLTLQAQNPVLLAFGMTGAYVTCFLLFPVCRNNIISYCFRTSYVKLLKWHALLMYALTILITVHGAGMLIHRTEYVFVWESGHSGIAGFLAWLCLIGFLTSGALRVIMFRVWHILHIVLFLTFFIMVHIHFPPLWWGTLLSVICYVADLFYRWKDFTMRKGHIRNAVVLASDTVGIEIEVSTPLHTGCVTTVHGRPGEFVLVHVNGYGESKPFALASRSVMVTDFGASAFLIAVKTTMHKPQQRRPFTWKLLHEASQGGLKGRAVNVSGPFGGMRLQLRYYETLLLVAGGIGITPVLSLLDHLVNDPMYAVGTTVRKIVLTWSVKRIESFRVGCDAIAHALKHPAKPFQLEVRLHVTNSNPISLNALPAASEPVTVIGAQPRSQGHISNSGFEMIEAPTTNPILTEHPLFQLVKISSGRPNISYLFANTRQGIAENANGRSEKMVAVFACGPRDMMAEVEEAGYAQSDKLLRFHVETFEFRI